MAANQAENQLRISWHDSAWIPRLNGENVLDYFCQRTNPFYDRTCNNEVVKMQRLDPSQLQLMTGIEYELIHGQDPILYLIRKQYRHSAEQVTFLSSYYILAGVVYQAPDLGSVLNSRLLSTVHNLEQAFDEALSYSKYTPSKGYWWDFKDDGNDDLTQKKKRKKVEEPSSLFQRFRVDQLLGDFVNKFPPKVLQQEQQPTQGDDASSVHSEVNADQNSQPKEQTMEPNRTMEPPMNTQLQRTAHSAAATTKIVTGQSTSPVTGPVTTRTNASLIDSKPLTPPAKKRKL
eukprot:Seg2488.3 transcript_id=Seg2488.3/GoldUCD/mRNA.D3Y31 product="Mediator of RNA polymerase II transcription subunit 6" protein_id=Seg2488.3/GoldUCD/D3Y31